MSRTVFHRLVAIGLLAFAMASARAAEMPFAVHPGQKALGAGDARFVLPESAARAVSLDFPPALLPKAAGPKDTDPPNRVGISRREALDALPTAGLMPDWQAVEGGFAARFAVRSAGALRLRVGIVVPAVPDGMEIRVGGPAGAPTDLLRADWIRETYGAQPGLVWTPATPGETQVVELFMPGARRPDGDTGLVHDVSHLHVDPFAPPASAKDAKLLECHQNFSCSSDATLRGAGTAVARMVYTSSGSTFVCTGSLLNDTGGAGTYFATAYHCIATQAEAASLQFGWFFERLCNLSTINSAFTTTQGSVLVRTSRENDFTLLRVTGGIPAGAGRLGWSSSALASNSSVYGIHHPAGEWKAFSNGASTGRKTSSALLGAGDVLTITGNGVQWSAGITEPGSSGSPLMTGAGVLRGTLSMGPRNQTCSSTREATYSDFSLVYPLVRQFISPGTSTADDYPDTAAAAASTTALDNAFLKVRLDSPTDQDWFKFTFPQAGVWILYTSAEPGQAPVDTYGRIYASDGTTLLRENDDDPAGAVGTNFAFYLRVNAPGTFYLQVTGFGGVTGSFELNSIYDPDDDHSDLAFLGTPLAPGQSLTGFIDAGGDSDYFIVDVAQAGAVTLSSSGPTDVIGVLRDSRFQQIAFNDDVSATDRNFRIAANLAAGRYYLQVIGYDVTTSGAYTVSASLASAAAPNYTGLWWIPSESGWGINTNHQGDVLFATLFTYATDGQAMWLVASNLARQPDGSFTGQLFRTRGPPFFTNPWTPNAVTASPVGTMTWRFNSPTSAQLVYTFESRTVTKNVVRQEFAAPVPTCTPTTASRSAEANYQDLWWGGPSESGWGINFTHQGTTIFGTLFNYDETGRDVWTFATLARQGDGSFTGDLFVAGGPPYFTQPWTAIATAKVGTMTFRPTAGDRGTLSYVAGTTPVVKSIQRQDFGLANRPVCR
jgi:hypothetical protein